MNKRIRLRRPCKKCNKTFTPTGKFQKFCEECKMAPGSIPKLKIQYFKSKEELDIIRSNETLAKWKVLSRTYKLGKKIWGSRFSRQRLAFDMDIPITTVLRCLTLDKANKKSLKLMNQNKISAFKLAMICQLKVNKLSDINKERHRLAIENGYSRQSSAAENFQRWIERGKLFLILKEKALIKTKYEEIKKELKKLNQRIERYLK